MKNTRHFTIANFKNISIDNPARLYLNEQLPDVGGLVVILGENNVGKSNVLKALEAIGGIKETGKPNFIHCKETLKITLAYTLEDFENKQKFEGKTFALSLSDGSLKKL